MTPEMIFAGICAVAIGFQVLLAWVFTGAND